MGAITELLQGDVLEQLTFRTGSSEALAEKIEMISSLSRSDVLKIGDILRKTALGKSNEHEIKGKLAEIFET